MCLIITSSWILWNQSWRLLALTMVVFICALKFFTSVTHVLLILIRLEMISVSLMLTLCVQISLLSSLNLVLLFVVGLAVGEASLGLSLLVNLARYQGVEEIASTSLFKLNKLRAFKVLNFYWCSITIIFNFQLKDDLDGRKCTKFRV